MIIISLQDAEEDDDKGLIEGHEDPAEHVDGSEALSGVDIVVGVGDHVLIGHFLVNHDAYDGQEGEDWGVPKHQVSVENGHVHEEIDHGEELLNPGDDHASVEDVFGDLAKRAVRMVAVVQVQFLEMTGF